MTPEEYREKWKVYEFKPERGEMLFEPEFIYWELDETSNLSSTSQEFLTQFGMPTSAAPFLSFYTKQQINDLIGPKYYQIGGDGCGNPIVLDSTDNVLWLEHETGFKDSFFINSSLPQFADCLLVAAEAIRRKNTGNEDPDLLYDWTLEELGKIDREYNHYWPTEIDSVFTDY